MKKSLLLACLILIPGAVAQAEPLIALTSNNQLIRFSNTNPGATTTPVTVTGLTAGDVLAGIDVRPLNNTLYGFATDAGLGMSAAGVGRVYSINFTTGVATLAATLSADGGDSTAPFPYASVAGSFFGVDFNPVADRLRVTTDTGQNLRINLANGFTQLDVPLAYVMADPNFGTPPAVVASAYTNSVAGAMSTLLYNLDSSISTLVTQAPTPNNGTLNTQGLTTGIVFPEASFDISGQTGIGYVVLDGVTLSRINLANGEMTEVGPIGAVNTIAGIAVLVPEPASAALLGVAFACLRCIGRRKK